MEMETELLCKYDTTFCADSVEWCPIAPYHRLFVCGNYQLAEDESNGTSDAQRERFGRVLLFEYVDQLQLLQTIDTSAVLDQKWCSNQINAKPTLAVVTAKGTLDLYTLNTDNSVNRLSFWLNYAFEQEENERLLLSVDWSTGKYSSQSPQLVCSDNRGNVHLFQLLQDGLKLLKTWNLHSHEAWICAFDYWDDKCFFSGADDAIFIKTNSQTSLHIKNKSHDSGVTSMHSNISQEHMFATGSYDSYVRIWDTRMLKSPISSIQMNGPVWRVKWDPHDQHLLIAACMDGGVSIIDSRLLDNSAKIVLNFTEHESIAYGADWCHDWDSKLIATCSFYDHLMCVAKIKVKSEQL